MENWICRSYLVHCLGLGLQNVALDVWGQPHSGTRWALNSIVETFLDQLYYLLLEGTQSH